MIRYDHEAIALATREQLQPRIGPLDRLKLEVLIGGANIEGRYGPVEVRARCAEGLPFHVYGVTVHDGDTATIWLNREAWPELARKVPRTRFTVAHEIGHIVLHGDELVEMDDRAEPEHQAQLEREANAFAACLLIPDAALKRLNVEPSTATSEILAKRFGVSVAMATKRLDEWRARR